MVMVGVVVVGGGGPIRAVGGRVGGQRRSRRRVGRMIRRGHVRWVVVRRGVVMMVVVAADAVGGWPLGLAV
jgi:hypothetical protein